MLRGALESGLVHTLLWLDGSGAFPAVVGGVTFVSTLSMSLLMAARRLGVPFMGIDPDDYITLDWLGPRSVEPLQLRKCSVRHARVFAARQAREALQADGQLQVATP